MKDLIHRVASTNNDGTFVIYMGAASSVYFLVDIFKESKLKAATVVYTTTQQQEDVEEKMEEFQFAENFHLPETFELVSRKDYMTMRKPEENLTYVFDGPDSEALVIEDIQLLRPRHVIGVHNSLSIQKFNLWETAREFADTIYILSWSPNLPEEIMDWKRNPDSDVELSVVFPMYNVAKYLEQCVDSVLVWQAPYVEFLFVDDGSPDNCCEIIEEYSKKDSRVKLLKKKNGGCASARQYGMERAKGQYIGFIDPDDYIDPTMYHKLLSRALVGNYQIAYCGYKEYYENTGKTAEVDDNIYEPFCFGCRDRNSLHKLVAWLRVAIWRGIYRKDLIDAAKIHFYTDLRRFDDLPFKVEIHTVARSVVSVPEHLYYYRLARPGQDVAADDERLYVHFDIFRYIDKFIEKKATPDLFDYVQLCKINTHRYAIEKIKPEYLVEYCTQASADLLASMSYKDSKKVLKQYGSKSDRLYLFALCRKQWWLVKQLKKKYQKKPL